MAWPFHSVGVELLLFVLPHALMAVINAARPVYFCFASAGLVAAAFLANLLTRWLCGMPACAGHQRITILSSV